MGTTSWPSLSSTVAVLPSCSETREEVLVSAGISTQPAPLVVSDDFSSIDIAAPVSPSCETTPSLSMSTITVLVSDDTEQRETSKISDSVDGSGEKDVVSSDIDSDADEKNSITHVIVPETTTTTVAVSVTNCEQRSLVVPAQASASEQLNVVVPTTNSIPTSFTFPLPRPFVPFDQHQSHRSQHHCNHSNIRVPLNHRVNGFQPRRVRGGGAFQNNNNLNRGHAQQSYNWNLNQSPRGQGFYWLNQPQRFIDDHAGFHRQTVPYALTPQANVPPSPPVPHNGIPYGYFGEPYYPEVPAQHLYWPPNPSANVMRGMPLHPQAPPLHMPQHTVELCNALRQQIEYYFSDANLVGDHYLKSQMDGNGWVSVKLISTFFKVQELTYEVKLNYGDPSIIHFLICEALQPSTTVEVQSKMMRRRGDWMKWVSERNSLIPACPPESTLVSSVRNINLNGQSGAECQAIPPQNDNPRPS